MCRLEHSTCSCCPQLVQPTCPRAIACAMAVLTAAGTILMIIQVTSQVVFKLHAVQDCPTAGSGGGALRLTGKVNGASTSHSRTAQRLAPSPSRPRLRAETRAGQAKGQTEGAGYFEEDEPAGKRAAHGAMHHTAGHQEHTTLHAQRKGLLPLGLIALDSLTHTLAFPLGRLTAQAAWREGKEAVYWLKMCDCRMDTASALTRVIVQPPSPARLPNTPSTQRAASTRKFISGVLQCTHHIEHSQHQNKRAQNKGKIRRR